MKNMLKNVNILIILYIYLIDINNYHYFLDCEKKRKQLKEKITGLESEEKTIGNLLLLLLLLLS